MLLYALYFARWTVLSSLCLLLPPVCTLTLAHVSRRAGPLTWLDPGPFGTLGVGAGFALAAKLCHPDAEVWLIYGGMT